MSGGEAHGRLVSNLMYFARLLRAAGLPIGPGKVLDAVAAVRTVGLSSREDFYWALHAVFVNHRRQRALFDQAFHLFWRNPRLLERLQNLALPSFEAPAAASEQRLARRLAAALAAGGAGASGAPRDEARAQATLSWSHGERLRHVDFESMSALEIERAKAVIAAMGPSLRPLPTRRFEIDSRGARVDVRATLRVAMRAGGVGLGQNLRPLLGLSLAVAVTTAGVSLWVQPYAARAFQEALYTSVKSRLSVTTETGIFTELASGITVYAGSVDPSRRLIPFEAHGVRYILRRMKTCRAR